MNQVVTKGIVLSRTDFGESDRILTILTQDQGKIRAIAKGVRKIKSKLAAGIELFSVSQISFIRGKSEIYTLTSTRLDKHYGEIVKDIDRTMYTYDVLKNINRITEDNTDSDYFDLLKEILETMNDLKISLPIIQFWLNLQLLKLAGHTPNLQSDLTGQKLDANSFYDFDLDKMSFIKRPKGDYSQHHIKLLRLGLNISSPQPLTKIVNLGSVLPGCLRLSYVMTKQLVYH